MYLSIYLSIYLSTYLSIYSSIYPSLYHLPHVCRTLVPKIHACPKMILVFWYIDVLTCVIYNSTQLNTRGDWSYSLPAMEIIDEDKKVNAQIHAINGLSLLKQGSCSCPATCQHVYVIRNDQWADCTAVL